MRRKDGRMSKKDRRAIEAFGLRPSDDTVLLGRIRANEGTMWTNTAPITLMWNSTGAANGSLYIDLRTQQVSMRVGNDMLPLDTATWKWTS